jgi:hypothetical protein
MAAAVLALVINQAAQAQTVQLQERLRKATRIECKFTALATGDWKGTTAQAAVSPATLEATFVDIDIDGGTAEAEGDLGESFIVVRYSHGYLHLMQISDAGPLRVTTVLAQPTSGGRMKAVQTRHEFSVVSLPGYTSRPEMYVGDCAVS